MIVAVDDNEHSAYVLEWTMLLLPSVGLLLLRSSPDLGFSQAQIWVFLKPRSGFFSNPDAVTCEFGGTCPEKHPQDHTTL
ncbi:hypothetical protein SLE2022_264300 [Rubroshorea leprosula]